MLLYLGNSDNENITKLLNDRKLIIKNIPGEINFKKFVIHDMKNLDHYNLILVNLESLLDSEDEIIETITAFKVLYKPRLIVFTEKPSKRLLYRIGKEANLYDIIIPFEDDNIESSLRKSLDDKVNYREQIRKHINKINLKYCFPYKDIKILIGGIGSTFNTTKISLNLATFLNEIGAKTSYTEVADSGGYLRKTLNHYKINNLKHQGISFFYKGDIPLNYDFNVIDMGRLDEKNLKVFNSKDFGEVKIICNSSKEFEIRELVSILEENNQAKAIISYSSNKEKKIARRILKKKIIFILPIMLLPFLI